MIKRFVLSAALALCAFPFRRGTDNLPAKTEILRTGRLGGAVAEPPQRYDL